MTNNHLKTIACVFPVLFFLGCDLPFDMGPQPSTLIKTEFEEGLNILGILRNDDITGSSFVRVEEAFTTPDMYEDEYDPLIKNARVMVFDENNIGFNFDFEADTSRHGVYISPGFNPQPGMHYSIQVISDILPELNSDLVIPTKPVLSDVVLDRDNAQVRFTIEATGDSKIYDLFVYQPRTTIEQRVFYSDEATIRIEIDYDSSKGRPFMLSVYGYEENLAAYMTSTLTFKPQTYQEPFSTVNGGYGCFGALALTEVFLQ